MLLRSDSLDKDTLERIGERSEDENWDGGEIGSRRELGVGATQRSFSAPGRCLGRRFRPVEIINEPQKVKNSSFWYSSFRRNPGNLGVVDVALTFRGSDYASINPFLFLKLLDFEDF